jgi:hypothetical protein
MHPKKRIESDQGQGRMERARRWMQCVGMSGASRLRARKTKR